MGAPLTTTHDTWRLVIAAVIVALALPTTLGATSAWAASPSVCRVQNAETGKTHKALQPAVDAAKPGARLVVKGTCRGITVIAERLAIKGVRTSRTGKPILDGDGKGPVLRIKQAATVTIRGLVVRGGVLPTRRTSGTGAIVGHRGAGILNRGTVRLRGVDVRGNVAWIGAGFYNAGVLRLRRASRVRSNSALPPCTDCALSGTAGLYNTGTTTLRDASSIRSNFGSGVENHGRLVLADRSSVERNRWGLGVWNYGMLTMTGSATVRDNTGMEGESFGVYSVGGDVTMNDASSIADHRGSWYTWGLRMTDGGTLTMSGSSAIRGNRGHSFGGGLGAGPDITLIGVTCGAGGSVHDNSPHDCSFRPASP